MKTKGIRIFDKKNGIICVTLPDILEEIRNGNLLHWSILDLESTGDLGEGKSIPVFEKQIIEAKNGYFIEWKELNFLSNKFYQIMHLVLIGCRNKDLLHRYDDDQEMYETCDIVIVMFDSWFWEIFSKDENLINKLASKFMITKTEFIESDFQKNPDASHPSY